MGTFRQPTSLQELCYRKSGALLYDLCCMTEVAHGSYDKENCRSTISNLQQYFLATLFSVFDDVGKRALNRHLLLNYIEDCRVLYAVIIHDDLESFSILNRPKPRHSSWPKHVIVDFLCASLSQLTNLVYLHVSGIDCCDTVLEVIGNNCTKLKSLTLFMPNEHSNYIATDLGIEYLSALPNLRVLRDSSGNCFKNINKVVIFKLVKVLTNLEEVESHSIGEIVDDYVKMHDPRSQSQSGLGLDDFDLEVKPLKLTCVKVDLSCGNPLNEFNEPSSSLISSLALACPNLSKLQLLGFDRCLESTLTEFIANLTNSSIKVIELELEGFPIDDSFVHFLTEKGKYLKHLKFSPPQLSRSHLELISRWCPNVTDLRLTKSYFHSDNDEEVPKRTFSIVGGLQPSPW